VTGRAVLRLQNHNPDVLTCIASLTNDLVFTTPSVANQMLDDLEKVWAQRNKGEDIWSDKAVRFLDPFTKSGVFLREITRRLVNGLSTEIPDLDKRVDHILTRQVFGLALTELTGQISRRSLYCSKHANGINSIATSLSTEAGNIWFESADHVWDGNKCTRCTAPRSLFEHEGVSSAHAYPFIHEDDPVELVKKAFGEEMNFDVVIGNPPYQMTGGGGGSNDSSIYHLFVEQAIKLDPKIVSMVVPARWLAGGRGLDQFRKSMLESRRLRVLVDFPDSSEAFPGLQIKGGICHFVWDSSFDGECEVMTVSDGEKEVQGPRRLDEFDVFVRDKRGVEILRQVLTAGEKSVTEITSGDTPFGIPTNFRDYWEKPKRGAIGLHMIIQGKRSLVYIERSQVTKNEHLVDSWKVLVPKAYGAGEQYPHQILGRELVSAPGSVCSQSYMVIGPFDSEVQAENFRSYYRSRFFRFQVHLRKITQDALRSTYSWVPVQDWAKPWTDNKLYEKYQITEEQVQYIESMIRPMELEDG